MNQSLRTGLANLEAAGQLTRISSPVHWRFEAAAIIWELARGPAVVMENVVGYPGAVIAGNIVTSLNKFASAMGWALAGTQARVAAAPDRPIVPIVVADGPVQAKVQTSDIDVCRDFPVPIVSEHDGGRYISGGVVVTKDPISGRRNVCIQRIQVHGPDRLGIFMAATDNLRFFTTYRARKQRMPVAIVIGNHPAVVLASQFKSPGDEFEIAGSLLDEPVRLVKCRTVDLEVPADAEIVLEGYVDPEERAPEGPFGELLGLYSPQHEAPVVHITAVTTRPLPIFQMFCAGYHPEHLWTSGIVQEAMLFNAVKAAVPCVRSVCMPEEGFCRYNAVISIAKQTDEDVRWVFDAALGFSDRLKHVIVVDDDVDPANQVRVQQALVTRMRAERDLQVTCTPTTHHMDPTMVDGTIARVLIDATLGLDNPVRGRASALPPAAVVDRIRERLGRR